MTEKYFCLKIFFVIKHSRFKFIFYVKTSTPLKKVSPFPRNPLWKLRSSQALPPFFWKFENWDAHAKDSTEVFKFFLLKSSKGKTSTNMIAFSKARNTWSCRTSKTSNNIFWFSNKFYNNLTLAQQFWATKVCLWVSKISKMSVWLHDWASNFLKSKFWKFF